MGHRILGAGGPGEGGVGHVRHLHPVPGVVPLLSELTQHQHLQALGLGQAEQLQRYPTPGEVKLKQTFD